MILSIKNVTKTYQQAGNAIHVLNNLNLKVAKGQTAAIVGPSGSGKSTLLSLMAGIDRPTSGQIHFIDKKMSDLSESELTGLRKNHISMIFQDFYLFSHLTALENVGLPLEIRGEKNIYSRAESILKRVGLGSRMDHFPNQLSGGEVQRVAIARSILTMPDLLLADEPTGNLDYENAKNIVDLLFELVDENKMTLILVTHNEVLAKRCQKIYSLKHGSLYEGFVKDHF